MAVTPSHMLLLGTVAPDFTLLDTVTGKMLCLNELRSPVATVVMFICNHCPFVVHVQDELVNLAKQYQRQNISFIAISSNDVTTHPADGPEEMHKIAMQAGYTFPYLYDETQIVAKAYQAACTPDFYVFDDGLHLVYRGRMDESRPRNNIAVTGHDLRAALDAVLAGKPVDEHQQPSMGCNIKWKSEV